MKTLLLVAVAIALASCAEVISTKPAGETPAKLDAKKWNGAWSTDDGESIHARVKDADKGLLEVAWLEVKEDAIELKKFDVYIRQAGGWLWASYKEDNDKGYTIARVGEPGENLLAWTMRFAPVTKRVKSGALKGEVLKDDKGNETKTVLVEGLHDADLQAIREGKWGDLFDWDKPGLNVKHHRD